MSWTAVLFLEFMRNLVALGLAMKDLDPEVKFMS
jgi:hypothetical protein